ncbi:unnamed protein product [Bursaphelenchus xylophilus]|uniref:(pine wood nematode) hypothetical protein n=1 Tax=Bursaphelenchus xylophilus TaxID=6326 RepID=A0A1I7SRM0_BURXY|nr:unnamed protein product [Bursaphelenchus xylophilus]CAG9102171.1 unnamed protein product [Bursaphelenchus xylophilus]
MLGMMNSPTDAVDFYATPSSTSRFSNDNDMKVFSEAKDRQHISYTKDGRKLVDGKLEEQSEITSDPMKAWSRLILNRIATNQIPKDLEKKSSKTRKLLDRLSGKKVESEPMPEITIVETVTVTSANPRFYKNS